MADPIFNPINPSNDGFVLFQPVTLGEGESLYPEQYNPDVQATVEERLGQIIFQLNRAAQLLRALKFAQMSPLVGGIMDDIKGFRVFREADEPSLAEARYGDIWLQPDGDNPALRVPRVFDGVGFVEGLYAIDAILLPIKARLQALEAAQAEYFGNLIDDLRTELRDGVGTERDTLKKLSDAIDAISVPLNDLALTGVPTAPTAALGTNTTQIANMAAVKAAADAAAAASIPVAQKGAANGVAELDSGGKVPAGQLPSYVDDVIEAANFAALPGTGETGKIYVTLDNGKAFRWSGSAYIEIVASPGSTDALAEGATNKYFTDARAIAALASSLALKQNLLSGASGQVLAFDGTGAPVARNAPQRLSTWYFTSDGVTDCTTALQAYLNLAGSVTLADGTYVATALTVPANTELTGSRNAILKKANTAGTFITIGGDNVILRGFTVDGTHTDETRAGGYIAGHIGISCVGTSSVDRRGIRFEDLLVKNFGDRGIYTRWTHGLRSIRNRVERCGYAGEEHLSPIYGECEDCHWENIFPGQTGNDNAYGGVMTASGTDRVPMYSGFSRCTAKDVTSWVGIDIHYGKDCWFDDCDSIECAEGVTYQNGVAGAPGANIDISNCRVRSWSGTTKTRDGRAYTKTGGILFVGAATGERATNVSIRGCTVIDGGDTRPGTSGAIFVRNVDGLQLTTNKIYNALRAGISLQESDAAGSCINVSGFGNVVDGVTAHGGVCRGIDMSANTRGLFAANDVFDLATGTERYYQDPAALNPVTVLDRPREVLQADRTYYVRADGSDSNSGRVDSAAGAWRSVQTAIDRITAALDIPSSRVVTIKVGNGSFTEAKTLRNFVGGGLIVIEGSSSPSDVDFITSASGVNAITADRLNCRWHLKGLRVGTTGSGLDAINARGPGTVISFENLAFDVTVDDHLQASEGAQINAIGDYFITAGANRHVNAFDGGRITTIGRSVAISNTPAFSYFSNAARHGVHSAHGMTFTGTGATGARFLVDTLGLIFVNGAGANYFPGNAAGTANAPGAYL